MLIRSHVGEKEATEFQFLHFIRQLIVYKQCTAVKGLIITHVKAYLAHQLGPAALNFKAVRNLYAYNLTQAH